MPEHGLTYISESLIWIAVLGVPLLAFFLVFLGIMFVVQSWKRTGPQCIDAKLVRPQIEDKTYAQEDRSPNRV